MVEKRNTLVLPLIVVPISYFGNYYSKSVMMLGLCLFLANNLCSYFLLFFFKLNYTVNVGNYILQYFNLSWIIVHLSYNIFNNLSGLLNRCLTTKIGRGSSFVT